MNTTTITFTFTRGPLKGLITTRCAEPRPAMNGGTVYSFWSHARVSSYVILDAAGKVTKLAYGYAGNYDRIGYIRSLRGVEITI